MRKNQWSGNPTMIHCMSFLAAFKVGAWLHKLKGWWRGARFVVQGKLVGFILFFFQNIALLFPPQERILVNRFGSRGLSKFVSETWLRKCIDREGLGRRAKLYPFIQMGGANVMWVHYIREVSNNYGDGLLRKRHLKSRAASNFIALIPSRLIRQMLANFFFFDVEF